MNKKLQVFISSTYTDLIEERQTAVEAILDAGHIPAGMELFKAGKTQLETIKRWIDNSDVYMLILGGRYGSIDKDTGLSYTELEYQYALSKKMPVFSIVLDDSFLHTKAAMTSDNNIFETKNKKKYYAFKNLVKSEIVKFVKSNDLIPAIIHSQLNDIMNNDEYDLIGWIRADGLPTLPYEDKIKKIGHYTYNELVNIFKVKTFPQSNERSENFLLWKYRNAIDIFLDYYRRLCIGIDDAYNQCNENFIFENFDEFDDDYHFCQYACPYFMSFDLICYSNQKYIISNNGKFFYSQLLLNGDNIPN